MKNRLKMQKTRSGLQTMHHSLQGYLSALLVMLGTGQAASGTVVLGAEEKIGIIDQQQVMYSLPLAQQLIKHAKSKAKPKEMDLKRKIEEYQTLKQKLDSDGAVISQTERKLLEGSLEELGQALREAQHAFQSEARELQNEMLEKLYAHTLPLIRRVAEEQNYSLVLDRRFVLFSNPEAVRDISQQVIELDEKQAHPVDHLSTLDSDQA